MIFLARERIKFGQKTQNRKQRNQLTLTTFSYLILNINMFSLIIIDLNRVQGPGCES